MQLHHSHRIASTLIAAGVALPVCNAEAQDGAAALDKNRGHMVFMESHLGGKQLHYSRTGGPEDFAHTFEVPAAGNYALTARVGTPSWRQSLLLAVNDAQQPVAIPLPHTVGLWDRTQPVVIALAKGRNVLRFSREHEGLKGITIRAFTLTPEK